MVQEMSARRRAVVGLGFAGSLIAALSVVALVAIVRPAVRDGLDDALRGQVLSDCSALSAALADYVADTGHEPRGFDGRPVYGWLRGPGPTPGFRDVPDAEVAELSWFLDRGIMTSSGAWSGPYLRELPSDPWGRAYVVWLGEDIARLGRRDARGHVWILSAGPNGVVDTVLEGTVLIGDDLGLLLH